MEAILVPGLSVLQKFTAPFPKSVPWYIPVSEVYRQFVEFHGLVSAVTYMSHSPLLHVFPYLSPFAFLLIFHSPYQKSQFKAKKPHGMLYRQCILCPNYVQSAELTTDQASCRNMINENRMYLNSILNVMVLNTHVGVIFLIFPFNKFAIISSKFFFNFVIRQYCV